MPATQLYINGQDAYNTWGVSLTQESLSALMTPPPLKDWITNDVRNEDGVRYIQGTNVPKKNERALTLTMHITAPDETTFFLRYAAFCSEVLDTGLLTIRTQYQPNTYYRCVYKSCSQFTQFVRQMATFGLSLVEIDPTNRAATSNRSVSTGDSESRSISDDSELTDEEETTEGEEEETQSDESR